MMIGLGATAMEVIYCFIAFTGLASFFSRGYVKAAMELFSFVFMLFLGIKFLLAKSTLHTPVDLGATAEKFEEELEERLRPHSAFMTGLVRTMGNLGVLVCWIFFSAFFISREWVTPGLAGQGWRGVTGVALGVGLWFLGLSWAGVARPWQIYAKDFAENGSSSPGLACSCWASSTSNNHPPDGPSSPNLNRETVMKREWIARLASLPNMRGARPPIQQTCSSL